MEGHIFDARNNLPRSELILAIRTVGHVNSLGLIARMPYDLRRSQACVQAACLLPAGTCLATSRGNVRLFMTTAALELSRDFRNSRPSTRHRVQPSRLYKQIYTTSTYIYTSPLQLNERGILCSPEYQIRAAVSVLWVSGQYLRCHRAVVCAMTTTSCIYEELHVMMSLRQASHRPLEMVCCTDALV